MLNSNLWKPKKKNNKRFVKALVIRGLIQDDPYKNDNKKIIYFYVASANKIQLLVTILYGSPCISIDK